MAAAKQRRVRPAAIAALAIALAASCGRSEHHEKAPHRIVSLTPSATELLDAVGAADAIVGVDDYSTYPPAITSLPRVGSFLSPNLEAILRLQPDLVIADDIHADVAGALHDAGIETMIVPMHDLADVRTGLTRIATRLDRVDAGKAALERMDAAIDRAGQRNHPGAPTVLAVIDRAAGGLDGMTAAGPGSWLDELLALEGARNALAGSGTRYPQIAPEQVLTTHPDVIIDVSFVAAPETSAHDWAGIDARIVVLHAPYLQAPSPRLAEALGDLDRALYATSATGP